MTPQTPLPSSKQSPAVSMPLDLPPIVVDARKILKEMASQLPRSITGLERQMMISDVMTRTDETAKMKLLTLMNHFLNRMYTLHASDIDMGGYGYKVISGIAFMVLKKQIRHLENIRQTKLTFLFKALLESAKDHFYLKIGI